MDKYEIIDFLEWAKENRQLEFPESRKVDMAERYLEEQGGAKNLHKPPVIKSVCQHEILTDGYCGRCKKQILGNSW